MNIKRFGVATAFVAAMGAIGSSVWARESCSRITRENLVRCALSASLSVEAQRRGTEAARAREDAARAILPSNPVLSARGARRTAADQGADFNWAAALAQELEIGGQRGARKRAAEFGRVSEEQLLRATRRDAAADAWRAYFEAIAAREELLLVRHLEETTKRVAEAAKAAADRGLSAGVEADVADASLVGIEGARVIAESKATRAAARLTSLLGGDPQMGLDISGTLAPLPVAEHVRRVDSRRAAADRPEVRALEAEANAERSRADVFRRTRVPNPTLTAFVERDGFAEHVLGVGIALPVPLPHPLGRTYAGEIAEAEALARVASIRARRLRREATRDLVSALSEYAARLRVSELFSSERRARAEADLRAMAAEVESGRLGVRDAIVAQQALMGLLSAAIVSERELCLASVELAVAAGIELERGIQ